MGKYHELDAPDLELNSSPVTDNSSLSFVYPELAKETRPLLKSDEDRHNLQKDRLNRSVREVLKHGFTIALYQTIPFAYVAIIGTFVYTYLNSGTIGLLLPVIVIGSFLWPVALVICYRSVMNRLHRHGISGVSVAVVTLISMAVGGTAVIPLALITDNFVANSMIFSGLLLGIATITTYLLLFLAVNSYYRGARQG